MLIESFYCEDTFLAPVYNIHILHMNNIENLLRIESLTILVSELNEKCTTWHSRVRISNGMALEDSALHPP